MKTSLPASAKYSFLFSLLLLAARAAQAQFNYLTNNGEVILTGYTGPAGPVIIPATINGLPVTTIEGSGFENKGITSVTISSNLTNIASQQFAPNTSLTAFTVDTNNPVFSSAGGVLFDKTQATLLEYPPGVGGGYVVPDSVTAIGPSAFAACYFLSGVTMSTNVASLGPEAFAFCFGLTSVTIPTGVSSIGPDAFLNCENLPAFAVDPANLFYSSVGGVLFDKNHSTLVEFPTGLTGSYAVPDGVTTIGDNAFVLCTGVTSVTMPASVTTIESQAFGDCTGLTTITFGAGVSQLATSVFAGCSQLTAINVDPANPFFSSTNGGVFDKTQTTLIQFPTGYLGSYTTPASVTSIAPYAAEDCDLSGLTLTAGVTSIGDLAFQGCGNLATVNILSPAASLGLFTFADCPKLTSVIFHGGVSSFGEDAFTFSTALTGVYFTGNAPASPDPATFTGDSSAIVYYLAGTTGWGSIFGGLPTMELQPIAITASPTNGLAPLTVNFTAAAMDTIGNPVTDWNWNFGDGSTSTAQNPSHTYTSVGTFTASVLETNSLGLPIAGTAAIIQSESLQPGISALNVSGSNVVLHVTNGFSGHTYFVLTSTNVALRLNQWQPMATDMLSATGNFAITISNAVTPARPRQFYILQTQ
jgi:hypothetical protein